MGKNHGLVLATLRGVDLNLNEIGPQIQDFFLAVSPPGSAEPLDSFT